MAHERIGPDGDHPQDHRADDDRRPSSPSRSSGRRSSTSRSTSRTCRSTTRCCAAGPRRGRWISARRRQARRDQGLRAARARRQAEAAWSSTSTPSPCRTCSSSRAASRPTRPSRSSTSGASLSTLNIVAEGVSRSPATSPTAATSSPRRSGSGSASRFEQAEAYKCGARRGRAALRRRSRQIIEARHRLDRRRDPALARLLHGHQRRGRDRPHLPDRRHGQSAPAGAGHRAARARRRSRSSRRSRRSRSRRRRSTRSCSSAAARSSPSRSASRCARTRRSARDSRQPPPAEARGQAARAEASQRWLLVVLGVVVARDRRRCSSSTRSKRDELAKQDAQERRAHEPDRRHQEGRRQPRRDQGPARGAARARGRHRQAAGGAQPGPPRCCSSWRAS